MQTSIERHAHFQLVDVDLKCVHAAYIQTSLCGLSADVIWGDTLKVEQWGSWRTFAAWMFPKRREAAPAGPVAAKPDQPSLFETCKP